jgi:hypothetical protein
MDLGFETIGNATLIVHDRGPLLVTDPWLTGEPYFGSWTHTHEIPERQLAHIEACPFVWISHGHPDHLCPDSLPRLRERRILLPMHVGGRIRADLTAQGYQVQELPTAEWVRLSDRVRVQCLPDYNQDAILLVDVGGALLIDCNDSSALGWMPKLRRETASFSRSFFLRLSGYGDPEMINFFDESGARIPPQPMKMRQAGMPVGPLDAQYAHEVGATHFIPFSSMHSYQREDSVWANECTTPLSAHEHGFESDRCTLLPAFVRYDVLRDDCTPIDPRPLPVRVRPPSDFGDDWSEMLEREDVALATSYFQEIEHLRETCGYVVLRVGGKDHEIALNRSIQRGVTFESPRHSLMATIRYRIFDDLLVGNFMKATLHGRWPSSGLYPDFTPYISKYADNGNARTKSELHEYFREYRRRAGGFEFVRHRLQVASVDLFRSHVAMDSPPYRFAKRAYWHVRAAGGSARSWQARREQARAAAARVSASSPAYTASLARASSRSIVSGARWPTLTGSGTSPRSTAASSRCPRARGCGSATR